MDKISVYFYRDSAVYQFYAEVVKCIETNIIAFMVRPTSKLFRIQRRNFYRLPIVMDVIIERNQNDETHKLKCTTKDLSGGGIRVVCSEEFKEGENIKIEIPLYKNSKIRVDGKVIRIAKDTIANYYELGIEFNKISQTDQDKIYSFIFKRQRLLRKRGLM